MDPSRNMSKYRNLVNSEHVQPPLIPFFPVVKKDLTFIHLGNDSEVEGLINFEKLRMIAKEVRHTCNMASAQYDLSQMYLRDSQTVFSAFTGMNAIATLRRKRRASTVINPKKMFEEAQMVRRVRAYLQNFHIEEDEAKLGELSHMCESTQALTTRKREPSPSPANLGPKFGAESPDAVRKLMGLSEKVRPHNPKQNPLPAHHILQPKSPALGRRPPVSPRQLHYQKPSAVNLSSESSSVVSFGSMATKKCRKSNSNVSESYSCSSSSIASNTIEAEMDSGHNSITSSNFDVFSSVSSSPPLHRQNHIPQHSHHLPPPLSTTRPPLPPYHVVIQQNAAYNEYLQQQYQSIEGIPGYLRPPLPDYNTATSTNRLTRPAVNHSRSHSLEGYLTTKYNSSNRTELVDGHESSEEQVSAV